MSEEKQEEKAVAADEAGKTGADAAQHGAEVPKASAISGAMSPVVFLLFMIFAMVVVLAVISLKDGTSKGGGVQTGDPAVAALKADLEARRSELNRQRMAIGLPPLEGAAEPVGDISARLKGDADTLVGLAERFQQMLGEKDAEISARSGEVLRLEKLQQDVSSQNARLQNELQRALTKASENDTLRALNADLQSQLDALSQALEESRRKLAEMQGAVTEDEFADLTRRYEETLRAKEFFENRVKELEAQLGQAKLFARSENELLPAAVELFRRLRKMEDQKDSDLTTEYSKLGVDLGANVLHTLDFKIGSSELSPEDMRQLSLIANEEIPDGDLTLIVGYASEIGDAASNERLSSDRATAAAEYFASQKRAGQLVQAVYLGQTDRFSSRITERNQICEVWRIRRK